MAHPVDSVGGVGLLISGHPSFFISAGGIAARPANLAFLFLQGQWLPALLLLIRPYSLLSAGVIAAGVAAAQMYRRRTRAVECERAAAQMAAAQAAAESFSNIR